MHGLYPTFPPKPDLKLQKSYYRPLFGLDLERPKSIYHLLAKALETHGYDLWGCWNTHSSVSKATETVGQRGC